MSVARFEDLDLSRQYTYADYLTWTFAERVELFRGWVARMSPAPNRRHQRVSVEFTRQLGNVLFSKPCQLFAAPFDVRLPRTSGGETVVQPDLCVVCDETKLTEQGCTGAPDFVIEIVSPGNSHRELRDKFELYEEAGVREYWVVHPLEEALFRYVLETETYVGLAPRTVADGEVACAVLDGVAVDLKKVFAE